MKKEESLLSFDYEVGRVFWRLFFPNGLAFLLSGAVLLSLFEETLQYGCNLKDCFGLVLFGFIVIGSALVTIEMFLLKEIRLYSNRIEKEWSIFGIRSLEYSNARLRCMNSNLASAKSFLYIKKSSWYKYKCCGYDEHLISKENKEKAIEILANISHRNINEFTEFRLEMHPFIQTHITKQSIQ